MATAEKPQKTGLFATKPIDVLVKETEEKDTQLKRAVGALDLTALGLGAIIGTGIFVIIGEAITTSGPSIVLAFVLAGVTCIFSALAFAELASAIPVSGSAYTYSYATLGELAAWIIGWDLILEYGVSIAAVAVGWGAYLNELLDSLFGYELPASIANPPGEEGGKVNLPAAFLVLAVTAVLMIGVRESARTNTIMVFFKLAVLVLFLVLGVTAFTADNFSPFFVEGEGFAGTVTAATLIFFAYIGFDAVSTSSEEVKEPKRDLPRADHRLAGDRDHALHPRRDRGDRRAAVRRAQGRGRPAGQGAERRRGHGVGREHHLLRRARRHHERRPHAALRAVAHPLRDEPRRPHAAAHLEGQPEDPHARPASSASAACCSRRSPRSFRSSEIVELVNIGTLFAFVVVNIGVIILRRTQPGPAARLPRPARAVVPDHRHPAVHLPDGGPARDRRGRGSRSGWRPASRSTSSTGAATRACAGARSSTPRPSCRSSGRRPGPPWRSREPRAFASPSLRRRACGACPERPAPAPRARGWSSATRTAPGCRRA